MPCDAVALVTPKLRTLCNTFSALLNRCQLQCGEAISHCMAQLMGQRHIHRLAITTAARLKDGP